MTKAKPNGNHSTPKDWVAIVLTIGLCTALNILVVSIAYEGLNDGPETISENATQIMTGTFGGIIGILGAYLGYRAASNGEKHDRQEQEISSDASIESSET